MILVLKDGSNQWTLGRRSNGADTGLWTLSETIDTGRRYETRVVLRGNNITVVVDGVVKGQARFGMVNGGGVGLRVSQAKYNTRFYTPTLRIGTYDKRRLAAAPVAEKARGRLSS